MKPGPRLPNIRKLADRLREPSGTSYPLYQTADTLLRLDELRLAALRRAEAAEARAEIAERTVRSIERDNRALRIELSTLKSKGIK